MDPTQKLLDLCQSLWLDNITNGLEGSSTAAASADYWLRQFARHSYFGASPAAVNAIQKHPLSHRAVGRRFVSRVAGQCLSFLIGN